MRHYFAVVHKEKDSAYGVYFPDVPGCFSAADSMDDLQQNAAKALALYFEDEPMNEPTTLETIKNNKRVAADLKAVAFLLAVPLIKLTAKTLKANITMNAGLLAAIDKVAKSRGITRSSFLADLARRELLD